MWSDFKRPKTDTAPWGPARCGALARDTGIDLLRGCCVSEATRVLRTVSDAWPVLQKELGVVQSPLRQAPRRVCRSGAARLAAKYGGERESPTSKRAGTKGLLMCVDVMLELRSLRHSVPVQLNLNVLIWMRVHGRV